MFSHSRSLTPSAEPDYASAADSRLRYSITQTLERAGLRPLAADRGLILLAERNVIIHAHAPLDVPEGAIREHIDALVTSGVRVLTCRSVEAALRGLAYLSRN